MAERECENLKTPANEADRGSKGSFSPRLEWRGAGEVGGGRRGDTIIQLLMERRIWSGIIKTNGGGGGVRGVCMCVCFHVCMFTCL